MNLAAARRPNVVVLRLAVVTAAAGAAWAVGAHELGVDAPPSLAVAIALAAVAGLGSAWST